MASSFGDDQTFEGLHSEEENVVDQKILYMITMMLISN